MIRLELPFPPSTNTAYANVNGRRVKTKPARQYASDVQLAAAIDHKAQRFRFDADQRKRAGEPQPRLAVRIDAHPPDKRRRDLGNLEKLAVDAVFAYLGVDDSLIDELYIRRRSTVADGRLVMTIREVQGAHLHGA